MDTGKTSGLAVTLVVVVSQENVSIGRYEREQNA